MPKADGITIEIDDREITAWLQHMEHQAGPDGLRQILDAIGAKMEEKVNLRFDTKTDPAGHKWDGHEKATTKRYNREDMVGNKVKTKGSLLERTGHMLGGLSYQVEGDAVLVGFAAPYAAYHEVGTVHMVRRGMLTADPETGTLGEGDRRSILDLIEAHFGGRD